MGVAATYCGEYITRKPVGTVGAADLPLVSVSHRGYSRGLHDERVLIGSTSRYPRGVEDAASVTGATLDSEELLAIARRHGRELSARLLETARAEGLIPRPTRAGQHGRTPIWLYPAGTERQLVALLRWRDHTTDPNLLRVLLWLDGFVVSPARLRDSIEQGLTNMFGAFLRDLERFAKARGHDLASQAGLADALVEAGRVVASKRGPNAIPRTTRVPAADRADAVTLMLRMFGTGEKLAPDDHQAQMVERVMGLAPKARKQQVAGAEPWLSGSASDLFDAADVIAFPALIATARTLTDSELEQARDSANAIFRYLPMMVRMLTLMTGDQNAAGLGFLRELDRQPAIAFMIVPLVVGLFRKGLQANVETITSALASAPEHADQAQHILDMPQRQIEANLSTSRRGQRDQINAIVDATLDGQVSIMPNRPPLDTRRESSRKRPRQSDR